MIHLLRMINHAISRTVAVRYSYPFSAVPVFRCAFSFFSVTTSLGVAHAGGGTGHFPSANAGAEKLVVAL